MATELTQEIPRSEWTSWLDAFSKEHRGWLVTIEVIGRQIGDQEAARRMSLIGVSADVKDGESRVVVHAGGRADEPDVHLTRIVDRATRVWLKPRDVSDVPVDETLAVEDESDTLTLIRCEHVDPGVGER